MNLLLRWWKFNLVGVMGFALQMAVLALLERCDGGHYLAASCAATEVTLLHNFCWHRRYTWRDCRDGSSRWRQLVRFHLSNGTVSMAGCVAVVWLLVHGARLPVMPANIAAVLVCAAANFFLGNAWVFAAAEIPPAKPDLATRQNEEAA